MINEVAKCLKCNNLTDGKHKLCTACLLRQKIYVLSKKPALTAKQSEELLNAKEEFYQINGYHYTPRKKTTTEDATTTALPATASLPIITTFTFKDNKLTLRDSRDVLLLTIDFTTGALQTFNEKLANLSLNSVSLATIDSVLPLITKIQHSLTIK